MIVAPFKIALKRDWLHPSQRGIKYWYRRSFVRWLYPYRVRIAIQHGVDEHYGPMYDWITENEPDHRDTVWLRISEIGLTNALDKRMLLGEIRFRSRELHTAFLLRYPVDLPEGYATI